MVYSRPLTYIPLDSEGDEALTANHFLKLWIEQPSSESESRSHLRHSNRIWGKDTRSEEDDTLETSPQAGIVGRRHFKWRFSSIASRNGWECWRDGGTRRKWKHFECDPAPRARIYCDYYEHCQPGCVTSSSTSHEFLEGNESAIGKRATVGQVSW